MIARLNEDESLALEKLDQRIGAEIGSKERAGEVILSKELTMEYLLGLMEIYNGKFNWKDHIDPLLFRFGPEASPQVAHAILRRETLAGDGAQGAKGGAAGDLTDVIGPDTFWEG